MSPTPQRISRSYTAIVVTFKRPDSLAIVLNALLGQSHPPSLVVIADNDPKRSAQSVVAEARATEVAVDYLPMGQNEGPAGGWGAAAEHASRHPRRGSWICVLDDDDPLGSITLMDALMDHALEAFSENSRVAAVGLRGARLSTRTMRLRRVEVGAGNRESVDYLAGNGAPTYRWDVVDLVGFFDRDLFFGFEDLDQGLRLRAHGWLLMACDSSLHAVADTAATRTPWREYYKTRALVTISIRHLRWPSTAWLIARSVVLGSILLIIRDRAPAAALARLRGAADGLRRQSGVRRYAPSQNPPKPSEI